MATKSRIHSIGPALSKGLLAMMAAIVLFGCSARVAAPDAGLQASNGIQNIDTAECVGSDATVATPLPVSVRNADGQWIRLQCRIRAPAMSAGGPIVLYFPGVRANLQVVLNGSTVLNDLNQPVLVRVAGRNRHRLVEIPAALWRSDANSIEVVAAGWGEITIPPLKVGDRLALETLREHRVLWQVDVPGASALLIGLLAILAMLIWWRQSNEPLYGWFGIGASLWSLHTAWSLSPWPALVAPHFDVWWTAMYLGFVAPLVVFCLRLAGWRMKRFVLLIIGTACAGPLILYSGVALGVENAFEEVLRFWCLTITAVGVAAVARYAFRRRGTTGALLLLAGVVSFLFGARDWYVAHQDVEYNPIQFTPFSGVLFALLMSWVLIDRFVASTRDLEQLNRHLEARVTERNRTLSESLAETKTAQETAERAAQSRAKFIADASHDLRQPLQALSLNLSSAREADSWAKQRDALNRAANSLEALRSRFNRILEMPHGQPPERVPFDLAGLLRGLADDVAPVAFAKELRLTVRIADEAKRWYADSDEVMVGRIVQNLLANAVKYTSAGGIVLRARLLGGTSPEWRIEVWDTGRGIAPEHQILVFDEYFQVNPSRSDTERGQGLGLSIVRENAAALGTAVDITSRPGVGSRFGFTLPGSPASAVPPEAMQLDYSLDGARIAVVEDESDVREAMMAQLEAWHCVVFAGSRADDLRFALVEGLDAIIADYRLGEAITGVEAVASLRARFGSDVPALILTGDELAGIMQEVADKSLDWQLKPTQSAKLRSWLVRRIRVRP